MEKNNINNHEDLQTSKTKRKIKRDLPPLPLSKKTSHVQKVVDAVEKTPVDGGKGDKLKSKKGKNKKSAEAKVESQVEDPEDRLQYEYLQQIADDDARALKKSKLKSEEENTLSQTHALNNDVGKKKKKKLKSLNAQSEEGYVFSSTVL